MNWNLWLWNGEAWYRDSWHKTLKAAKKYLRTRALAWPDGHWIMPVGVQPSDLNSPFKVAVQTKGGEG